MASFSQAVMKPVIPAKRGFTETEHAKWVTLDPKKKVEYCTSVQKVLVLYKDLLNKNEIIFDANAWDEDSQQRGETFLHLYDDSEANNELSEPKSVIGIVIGLIPGYADDLQNQPTQELADQDAGATSEGGGKDTTNVDRRFLLIDNSSNDMWAVACVKEDRVAIYGVSKPQRDGSCAIVASSQGKVFLSPAMQAYLHDIDQHLNAKISTEIVYGFIEAVSSGHLASKLAPCDQIPSSQSPTAGTNVQTKGLDSARQSATSESAIESAVQEGPAEQALQQSPSGEGPETNLAEICLNSVWDKEKYSIGELVSAMQSAWPEMNDPFTSGSYLSKQTVSCMLLAVVETSGQHVRMLLFRGFVHNFCGSIYRLDQAPVGSGEEAKQLRKKALDSAWIQYGMDIGRILGFG